MKIEIKMVRFLLAQRKEGSFKQDMVDEVFRRKGF